MSFTFPTPTPIFPALFSGYPSHMKPATAALVTTSVSGVETRSVRQIYPLWDFEVPFEVLRDQTQNAVVDPYYATYTELQQLCGLFLACRGQYGRFFYSCPEDNSRLGQAIGTGDGIKLEFRALRTIGTGTLAFTEPVGGINAGAGWKVYYNAVDDSANWSVSADLMSFVRISAPTVGAVITADFSFYYFCRFLEDLEDFEQFYHHLWTLKSCKFRSAKR